MDKAKLLRIALRIAAAIIGVLIADGVLDPAIWGAIATGIGGYSAMGPGHEMKGATP